MKNMKFIDYNDYRFIIQSYLKNDFVNLCELNGDSFNIDFTKKTIETSGKETQDWIKKKNEFVISEIKTIVDIRISGGV